MKDYQNAFRDILLNDPRGWEQTGDYYTWRRRSPLTGQIRDRLNIQKDSVTVWVYSEWSYDRYSIYYDDLPALGLNVSDAREAIEGLITGAVKNLETFRDFGKTP